MLFLAVLVSGQFFWLYELAVILYPALDGNQNLKSSRYVADNTHITYLMVLYISIQWETRLELYVLSNQMGLDLIWDKSELIFALFYLIPYTYYSCID